ncbi:MAG TPA: DEAD/DEAH box helicase [Caldithrix abyssi]|uniref:DEAD-box ATP-dependent RNA helicase RhpA n=1 Tax=Caldithrix abyssi TaxID=187145 RepID=A0A7V4U1T6_CALAY|nr:DEAD/DEAH box helicase [Caldithrix abyssi]
MKNMKTFNKLGLSAHLLQAIDSKGYENPTPIQALTIPLMLKNETNIIAQAQTGTGKTAAFGLPLIDMIDSEWNAVQALILTPTRELAIQVSEEINSLKGAKRIKTIPVYGGQSIDQQLRQLKKGVHIVVGTPGRIIDHLKRKTLKLQNMNYLVIDEADEMLNMGFIDDMEEIMRHTNSEKRTLLFSATMPRKIKELARKYMDNYTTLKVEKERLTTSLTNQIYFEVKASDKFESLCRIIDMEEPFYGLVFCRTKNDVDALVAGLTERGYDGQPIHGDISQAQRERTLDKFKKRKINILVATDVAARGIDVNNLSHVINYALPQDPESYVHRIGRTGRAGNKGTAITFITPGEYKQLMFIQRFVKTDIKKAQIPTIKDIIQAKKKKIHQELQTIMEKEITPDYYKWADKLMENTDPEELVAALLKYSFDEDVNPNAYKEIKEISHSTPRFDNQSKSRLFVALGRKNRLNSRKLIDLIRDKVAIKSGQISDIQVKDSFSFITVPSHKAEKIISGFKGKGRKPLITHARP